MAGLTAPADFLAVMEGEATAAAAAGPFPESEEEEGRSEEEEENGLTCPPTDLFTLLFPFRAGVRKKEC